jgi:uncharacterized repeat protein (TIGR02543 family)
MGSSNVVLYAKWTALPTYTVTYDANGGSGGVLTDNNNYLTGATVTVLGNGSLTKTWCTFAGWNTQADGNGIDRGPGATFAMGSSNVVLYAKWTFLPAYTVAYDANGGSGGLPADSNSYLTGSAVTVLGNGTLTRPGYVFANWNTQADGNGTDRGPGATFAMGSSNVVLYAKWTALQTYSVAYAANGGNGGLPADTNSYLTGATVTVQGNGTLSMAGYSFTCWNTQADGNGTDHAPGATFAMGSSNVVLYAKWTALPTYTVTYNANGGSGGLPSDTNSYLAGATVTVLGNGTLTKTWCTFAGWNTQANGNGTDVAPGATFAMGASNVTLYAKWTLLPTYTVTYNANGGSGGLPSDTNSYLSGATVTALGNGTLTKAGYSFAGWNTQADGNGTDVAPRATFAMGASNVTLYAKWTALPTYTVAYNANGGSGGLPADSNSYLTGAAVTVLGNGTLTNPGYLFANWNTQPDGSGTSLAPAATFAMGSSNVTLYSMWTALPTYTLTYNANGGSGGLPADNNSYLAGTTVTVLGNGTLTNPGNAFAGWNTQPDGSGTSLAPTATFTIGSANVTLYAVWTAIPTYSVTYNANGGSGGLPTDSNSYLTGATVRVLGSGTLTNPGNTFVSWSTQPGGSGTALTPAATFAMGSTNVTIYAVWTPIICPVNMSYNILISECQCDYLYVMQNGSCQLCPPPYNYTNGVCICIKSKTQNCNIL